MQAHYYNISVSWSEDRKGVMCSPELANNNSIGNNCIEVATPPQFPKGVDGVWSPEHLFTAAIASCFMTTFLSIAENSKLKFSAFSCNSRGKLEQINGKFLMTEVELVPTVLLLDESDRDRALRILTKTETSCLISNSVNAKIVMYPEVRIAPQHIET